MTPSIVASTNGPLRRAFLTVFSLLAMVEEILKLDVVFGTVLELEPYANEAGVSVPKSLESVPTLSVWNVDAVAFHPYRLTLLDALVDSDEDSEVTKVGNDSVSTSALVLFSTLVKVMGLLNGIPSTKNVVNGTMLGMGSRVSIIVLTIVLIDAWGVLPSSQLVMPSVTKKEYGPSAPVLVGVTTGTRSTVLVNVTTTVKVIGPSVGTSGT